MPAMPRYHLRLQLLPGPGLERNARDAARFCRRHRIEEVALFYAAEEWNDGFMTPEAEDRWYDAIKRAKPFFDRAGVATSLNPWYTTLHVSRGRKFPKGRAFARMVDPNGRRDEDVASFADPEWRKTIARQFARFSALGMRVVWIEDDWRYHNHGNLSWGGGFEEPVIARFEKKIGRKTTRAEVVRNILGPGVPHPWRAKWLENWRELQLEATAEIARAVRRAAKGGTKIGLMSSHPVSHAREGRDWKKLFKAMDAGAGVAHRPHYAEYQDGHPLVDRMYNATMLDIQRDGRPAGTEVAPELENYPYTAFAKSDAATWAEMAMSQFFGSDAHLLNVLPFLGNSVEGYPEVGAMLDRSRPALAWIAARFPAALATRGVGCPWREDAQLHVRTAAGKDMNELDASSFGPAHFLLPYGVPVAMRRSEGVNAVFGSLAWAFSGAEWKDMLSRGGLLLDGAAAAILAERGFAGDMGVAVEGVVARDDDSYSIEQVVSDEAGAPAGHYFGCNLLARCARLRAAGAREWTRILRPDERVFGAGLTVFRNARGGRVAVAAAVNPQGLAASFQRQAMTHRLVEWLAGGRFDAFRALGSPNVIAMALGDGRKRWGVLANAGFDPAEPVMLAEKKPTEVFVLAPLAKPKKTSLVAAGGGWRARAPIPPFGFLAARGE